MAIKTMQTLTQPKGTDVYNVAVFNKNAQAIQDAINGTAQDDGLIPAVNNLLIEIAKKYPYFTEQTNIDKILDNGIYYNIVSGSEPLENSILLSISLAGNNIQTLITKDKISQRTVTASSLNPSWTVLTTKVINSLTTGGVSDALSAEQGKILNTTKLNHYIKMTTALDLDNITEGIYSCSAGTTGLNIPATEDTNAVVIQYGDGKTVTSTQLFYGADNSAAYIRYRGMTGDWSGWIALGTGGGGGGVDLEAVDSYE